MNLLDKFKYCPVCGSSHFDKNSVKSKKCTNCSFEYFMNPAAAVVAFITNSKGELLIERRKNEPAKGTLDLPGGFADTLETAEESVVREVKEETGLVVSSVKYLFSLPNIYRYSGLDVQTLDMFYECTVEDSTQLQAGDDASECMWVDLKDIHTEQFGLRSVRQGLYDYLKARQKDSL
ncbi:MAG: NUDIX domain-containing protein [Prevotellaceae bacterium]|nr:NUDIX domain-containing protein [Prevotellaceae bacterium]